MKLAGIKLDLINDFSAIFGRTVPLNHMESGHYCAPLDHGILPVEAMWAVDICSMNSATRYKALAKLYNQFVNTPAIQLLSSLKDANAWEKNFLSEIEMIANSCIICKSFVKTPPKPVVN